MAESGLPPGDRAFGTPARLTSSDAAAPVFSPLPSSIASIGSSDAGGALRGLRGAGDLGLSGMSFSPAVSTSSAPLGAIGLARDGSTSADLVHGAGSASVAPVAEMGAAVLPGFTAPSNSSRPGTAGAQPPLGFGMPPVGSVPSSMPSLSSLSGPMDAMMTTGGIPPARGSPMPMARSASPVLTPSKQGHGQSSLSSSSSVPHGHVPLIPVSSHKSSLSQPLAGIGMMSPMPGGGGGASPMPAMMSSSAMGAAHQVPHALVAPLPFNAGLPSGGAMPEAPGSMPLLLPMEPEARRTAPLQHWFFCKSGEPWTPFSLADSTRLESAYQSRAAAIAAGSGGGDGGEPSTGGEDELIPTDGGRYDVELMARLRHAVFWSEVPSEVRRCMWFHKEESTGLFSPYSEVLSDRLESEYQQGLKYNVWQRKIDLPGGQRVVMHNAQVIADYAPPSQQVSVQQLAGVVEQRPRVVQRGLDETDELDDGEGLDIGHLVFVVNGIGGSDTNGPRGIIAHVDDFRQSSQCMLHEHFPHRAGHRVEYLPVQWNSSLRGDDVAVEKELADISLPNCGRLRGYTNSVLTDILFYSSPVYCQAILSSVANEMERVLELFQSRNPNFSGDISVVGHSLGACILFDLLAHQGSADPKLQMLSPSSSSRPSLHASRFSMGMSDDTTTDSQAEGTEVPKPPTLTLEEVLKKFGLESFAEKFAAEMIDFESFKQLAGDDLKEIGIPMGPRKKLTTFLREHVQAEEAYQRYLMDMKSRKDIAEAARREAERVRSEQAEADAQREAEQQAAGLRPFTYRSSGPGVGNVFVDYPQLSFILRSFFAIGSPIALLSSLRGIKLGSAFHLPTCPAFFNLYHPYDPMAYRMEPIVAPALKFPPVQVPHHKGRKRLHLELRENLGRVGAQLKKNFMESLRQTWQAVQEFAASHRTDVRTSDEEMAELERQRQQVEEELNKQEDLALPSEDEDFQMLHVPPIGILNNGQRIDYVLQERPFESFNEYMFSIQSHSSYWSSEDTSLLILRQLFTGESVLSTPADVNPMFR